MIKYMIKYIQSNILYHKDDCVTFELLVMDLLVSAWNTITKHFSTVYVQALIRNEFLEDFNR